MSPDRRAGPLPMVADDRLRGRTGVSYEACAAPPGSAAAAPVARLAPVALLSPPIGPLGGSEA
ncbi:hypothetical protein M8A51_14115 [Schlegelella sp. S2-27]|uniref:Uncharacterized protein n=1 Tax=Caldimonas mangrovi TaxID=2944811 RepID=A0ABT0YS20_9BURK|nr:hypothetical protein [Caldimonas mangrovi]MCM5680658.1 hypothetical protein [Caldimonas mangrovi]